MIIASLLLMTSLPAVAETITFDQDAVGSPPSGWPVSPVEARLDGKVYIETDDAHIVGPGAVGVWTKADSVTAFDDFSYSTATKP